MSAPLLNHSRLRKGNTFYSPSKATKTNTNKKNLIDEGLEGWRLDTHKNKNKTKN
jgi:hypothetical protein